MKSFEKEKHSLAWFKLAECVLKGEKERAIGVYKLLYHSVGNDALATQLYADILLSFEDKDLAIQKYFEAIELYKKEEKFIEAIAIYEHLLAIEGSDTFKAFDNSKNFDTSKTSIFNNKSITEDNVFDLCQLYLKIDADFKVLECLGLLIDKKKVYFKNFDLFFGFLQEFKDKIQNNREFSFKLFLFNQDLFFILIDEKETPKNIIISQIESLIDLFLSFTTGLAIDIENGDVFDSEKTQENSLILNDFLNKLKLKDQDLYEYAIKYIG